MHRDVEQARLRKRWWLTATTGGWSGSAGFWIGLGWRRRLAWFIVWQRVGDSYTGGLSKCQVASSSPGSGLLQRVLNMPRFPGGEAGC